MPTSRRDFLKSTMIAGAGVVLPPASAFAYSLDPQSDQNMIHPAEAAAPTSSSEYTRGIGIYPGAPDANFSPTLVLDNSTYRNLALMRPAHHSSSYDYNLTAQLVTDGIKDTHLPEWIAVTLSPFEKLPINERESVVNHFNASMVPLTGLKPFVEIHLGGGQAAPEIDRIEVFVAVPHELPAAGMKFTISVSDDGRAWQEMGRTSAPHALSPAGYPPDLVRFARLYNPSIPLHQVCRSRYYKVECSTPALPEMPQMTSPWQIGQVAFYRGSERVEVGGPYSFTSAWMSAGSGQEWVYVDLGARCTFDRVALYWIARAAEGSIQTSDDAETWRDLQPLSGTGLVDDIHLRTPATARYVRVLMTRPTSPDGYILSELEVYGRGGPIPQPHPAPAPRPDGRIDLAGGAWRLQRSNFITDPNPGEALSKSGFNDGSWLVATVPGTALTSYLNNGALPDPNYGKNQLYLSDSYFYSDFWYRTEFQAPALKRDQRAWLNFDGINWKADIFLNGEKLGRIEGGFMRGRFDVTGKLLANQPNALAVCVEKNATPGSCKQKTFESPGKNGGALGADNPTYHASIGWDWIPTIRGRNTGIWGEVYVTTSGLVTVEHPFVTTALPLPDISRADLTIEADLINHHPHSIKGTLRGRIGDLSFAHPVHIEGSATQHIKLDPNTHPELRLHNPQLWWPTGYGEPHLYDAQISFETGHDEVSDQKSFKAGLRHWTYSEDGGELRLWINGRRFVARGGNWGFGESMLRYRAREYDTAARYHREMNFTMVRNWVGQIGDEAFYEACDRNGIVVWQDFWLANPWDGPNPNDDALFLRNARDLILRIRNHASMGLYCGRNEGFPPPPLEAGLRKAIAALDPQMHYIPSSADDTVSGHGPYQALPPVFYFEAADSKLHSEIGMPNIPPIESVRLMMPEKAMWPQGLDWGLHDFCLAGAQGGTSFRSMIDNNYGGTDSAEEWITLAQFLNYEGYRAIFEAQSKYRMGVLLWMSHPCWPSFVWQTYDYYFEPTAAYFGCKKGSEPLHIQWNRSTDAIEVVNYSGGNVSGLTAKVEILNFDGSSKWSQTASVESKEDSTVSAIPMHYPAGLSPVHFLRLTLTRGGQPVSTNLYMRGLEDGNFRAIRELAKAKVKAATTAKQQGDTWILTTQLENTSAWPAIMVRLKAVREQSGDRILPAIYSDNYVTLLPGERQSLTTEVRQADTRGEKPRITVGGFNTIPVG